ncbi:MAG: high-affinity nickel-transporter, partial [Hyphomicrobiales bacterium]|nr:high-affinity nickel-transporter [Hyphomicrobiales bacterium]
MFDFSSLVQQGATHAWLFIPSAILLGVLHGLEPGHSKTMMAAFIVAVHGTVTQAVLLGLAATLSHTIVVWIIALVGLHFGGKINSEGLEPYFQLASGAVIIAIAVWMIWRTWREARHDHDHDHHHDDAREIQTRNGVVVVSIEETEGPPRWRIASASGLDPANVRLALTRPEGGREEYAFYRKGDHLESLEQIPEPH